MIKGIIKKKIPGANISPQKRSLIHKFIIMSDICAVCNKYTMQKLRRNKFLHFASVRNINE